MNLSVLNMAQRIFPVYDSVSQQLNIRPSIPSNGFTVGGVPRYISNTGMINKLLLMKVRFASLGRKLLKPIHGCVRRNCPGVDEPVL